jgi:PAS domain S-box-containing protein
MTGESRIADLEAELARLKAKVSELESKVADRRSERKLLLDQLRFLQTLIDTIPNPVFYKDKNGFYLGCNKAFASRMGLDGNEIVGKSASELFSKEVAAEYEQRDAELFAQQGEQTYDTKLVYPDGQEHDVIITKGIFTDSDGNVAGLVGVTLDITARKRAEEALQEAHDELERRVEHRTASLALANSNLEREIAERGRIAEELRISSEKLKHFAYSVAHDLKSPSVGIYGLARLLQKNFAEELGEKGSLLCTQILRASEHVASLVDAINVFIATKETPLKIEKIDMKEVFHALGDEFSARLRLRHISLIEPEKPPVVCADKISMLRVFRNLIDNSMKYGGDRLTSIRIGYQDNQNWHHFMVSDDGVGIQAEKSGSVFNWFQRQKASEEIEGTGLGLAIIKEIVELHQGDVRWEPGSEGGTVFHVRIAKDLRLDNPSYST